MTAQSRAEINGRRIMNVPRASSAKRAKPSNRSTGSASSRRASFSGGSFFDCACPVDMMFRYGRGPIAGCFSAVSAVSQAACIELNQREQFDPVEFGHIHVDKQTAPFKRWRLGQEHSG